jgi:hypothetical protein
VSETFDRFAQGLGGAYYPSLYIGGRFAQFVTYMQRCRERALLLMASSPCAASYRLENGWIFDGNFNACAGIKDSIDCIGINIGIAHVLCNLFGTMLGHQSILARIGDCTREGRPTYNPETSSKDLEDFSQLRTPNDLLRARYSYQLCYCAFHFIFLHEFAHLLHGHVDWLSRNVGLTRLGRP